MTGAALSKSGEREARRRWHDGAWKKKGATDQSEFDCLFQSTPRLFWPPRRRAPRALARGALLLFPLRRRLREHVASADRGGGAIRGVPRGCAEERRRKRERREARRAPLSCSCSLPKKAKRVNRTTRHRRPALRASLREASPQRPPEETQGRALCIFDRGAGAKPHKGLWRAKRTRVFCRRPAAAAAAAAASRSRSRRPLFLSSLFYVRFLAAALPALGHALVLSDRHG